MFLVFLPAFCPAFAGVATTKLQLHTIREFDAYVQAREKGIRARDTQGAFLWSAERTERLQSLRKGEVVVERFENDTGREIRDGQIHDWVGAVYIPGAKLDDVLRFIQNYDNHVNVYKPEVLQSKLMSRQGDNYRVHLRLAKKKVITVVLDTEYDVEYRRPGINKAASRSLSTRIVEVENPGGPSERPMPAGEDHGFLWRLHTFWRFQEQDGGVTIECEAISLSRTIPLLVRPLVWPLVRGLSRESLERTLEGTRRALTAQ